METFYLTDTGMIRDHNEGSVIIIENEVFEQHKMNVS